MTCFRMPDGMTLHRWCQLHRKPYRSIYRLLDNGVKLENAIKYKNLHSKSHPKLFYKRQPLVEYCGGYHTLQYRRIVNEIYSKNCSVSKAIQIVKEKYKDK